MSGASVNQFSVWDYVVFAIVLLISAGIGVFYGFFQKQKTMEDFMLGGRAMSPFPVSMSLLASFMSAITLLGTPAEIYLYGTQYMTIVFGYCIMMPIVIYMFCPIFYNLRITSVYEYLEMRFDKGVRVLAACVNIFQMTVYMAMVLYAPSLALNVVTGLNVWISVSVVGVVCIFYTSVGGLKAVLWTDTFQIGMMFAGLLAVLIRGSIEYHGFANIWKILEGGDRVEFWNFDPNPGVRHTMWTLTVGGAITWAGTYGVNQAQVQRALSVSTLKQAQLAFWINLPGLSAILIICSLCGAVIYAAYKDCDPLTLGRISARDQLLPLYVMDYLGTYKGLPGLFTACIFSGALSTISSGLNSLAAITLQDILRLIWFTNMTDGRATFVSKWLGVVYGVVMIALTFIVANLGGILQAALSLNGSVGGPTLALFTMAMLYPCINKWGAYAGYISSLVACIWISVGAQLSNQHDNLKVLSTAGCTVINGTENVSTVSSAFMTTTPSTMTEPDSGLSIYKLSYIYYGTLAMIVCHVVGIVVSLATGGWQSSDVNPKLIYPLIQRLLCCLPQSWTNCDHETDTDSEEKVPPSSNESKLTIEVSGVDGYDNPVMLNGRNVLQKHSTDL